MMRMVVMIRMVVMMRMVMTKANDDGDKYGDDEGSDYGEGDDGNN